jgi:polyhydroxyalkanoate synthesis regulator phasin
MVREALTNYWSLVSGLTEVTRQRARAVAKALAAQGEATVEQVSGLAEEILQTSRANRAALVHLVRYEVERTLSGFGLARAEDVAALQARVVELERSVESLTAATARRAAPPRKAATKAPPRKATPGKATTRKATTRKASTRKAQP